MAVAGALLASAPVASGQQSGVPEVSFSAPASVIEGRDIVVSLSLNVPAPGNVYALVRVEHVTAELSDTCNQYQALVHFWPDQNSKTVRIPTCADLDTDAETVTLRLASVSRGVPAPGQGAVTVTITEGSGPSATISVLPTSVAEGQSFTVTASLSHAVTSWVYVPLVITNTTAEASDYSTAGRITVRPNDTQSTVKIWTNRDNDADDEQFTVAVGTLQAGLRAPTTPPSPITLTITDPDTATATVSLSSNSPVVEGETALVTATLSGSLLQDVSIPLVLTLVNAETGDVRGPASVVIRARDLSGTAPFPTVRDLDLDNEQFTVALGTTLPAGVTAGSPNMVTVDVTDRTSQTSTVNLSALPQRVREGASTTITATLSLPAKSRLTIPLTVTRGSAEAGDFTLSASSITVPGGTRSGSVTVSTSQDADNDNDTFTVAVGALPAGYQAGTASSVQITIAEDNPPVAVVGADPDDGVVYVGEGNTKRLWVSLTQAPTANVTATVSIISGAAAASVSAGSSITFTPSDHRGKWFQLTGADDSVETYLRDARVRISLASTDADFDGSVLELPAKVVDDDASVSYYLADHGTTITAREGDLTITVTVKASRRVANQVSLNETLQETTGYRLRRDTNDYVPRFGSIPAGSDTGHIALNIIDTSEVEAVDLQKWTLTNLTGIDTSRNTINAELVDDDVSEILLFQAGSTLVMVFSNRFYTDVRLRLVGWQGQTLNSSAHTLYQGTTRLTIDNVRIEDIQGIYIKTPPDQTQTVNGNVVTGTRGWHDDWIQPTPGLILLPAGEDYPNNPGPDAFDTHPQHFS